ncbi:uncharacterized protein J4E92_005445 [Alternaria infectoria]|uniref:uncharacterized protein n=1 Tax=Alternaria infectoria TaxID=45303 RepID=UPI00221FD34F|nr:uncharacterized protein J4E92_005445 [Alternaria infectoria]KAI4927964.1 hypothetical protein J4E92_005445 [Alternaria infectoria]
MSEAEHAETFPFERLPLELQRHVLTYVLPQNQSIKFRWGPYPEQPDYRPKWIIETRPIGAVLPWENHHEREMNGNQHISNSLSDYAALIRVKTLAQEAKALFLHTNEITLVITSKQYTSELHFGPFKLDSRRLNVHTLRDIENLRIILNIGSGDSTAAPCNRLRTRLQQIVTQLTLHAEDKDQKSLLKKLEISVAVDGLDLVDVKEVGLEDVDDGPLGYLGAMDMAGFMEPAPETNPYVPHFMFALEPLVGLFPSVVVESVRVRGVPSWFARCLELCVRGQGGELVELDWGCDVVMRQVGVGVARKRRVSVTRKMWMQPVYDWRRYAEENGIEVDD